MFARKKSTEEMGKDDEAVSSLSHPIYLSHPYRIYLIDNESMGRTSEESWFKNEHSGVAHRISSQLTGLYFFPMLCQMMILKNKDYAIIDMYYEGFIKGYASPAKA